MFTLNTNLKIPFFLRLTKKPTNIKDSIARSHGLVVKAEHSQPRVVSSRTDSATKY